MPKRQLPVPTAEEDAAINRGIAADPDTWEWAEEDFKNARPASEVLPDLAADALKRRRGAQKHPTKVLVSLRLERDVVERLRASGPGWQSRVNDMLRKAVLGG
ncbi:MAG: BrnA antitoxin family protein [Acetobacteraceae bacterium]|nr:BrnA antitoxin family protein [Acetobacteraceae bacterium]